MDGIPGLKGISSLSSVEHPEKSTSVADKARDLKLRKAAKDFESIFIAQVIKAMEKTVPKSDLQSSSNTLPSMLFSTTLGKAVADQGGVGLSEMIYRSLKARDQLTESNLPMPEHLADPVDILGNMEGRALENDD